MTPDPRALAEKLLAAEAFHHKWCNANYLSTCGDSQRCNCGGDERHADVTALARGLQTNGAQQTLHQAERLKRNQRRYEIAREVLASMYVGSGWTEDMRGWMATQAVGAADALLAALDANEGDDDGR